MKMSDGTWKLIGDAEAFANLVNGYGIDELLKQQADFSNNRAQIVDEYGLHSESTLTSTTIGESAPDNTHKARVDYLKSFEGMDFSNIEGANEILTLDLSDTSLEFTKEQIDTINQMIGEVNSQELTIGDQIAFTAQSVDELNDLLAQGKIDAENYDKALQSAFENEIEAEGFDFGTGDSKKDLLGILPLNEKEESVALPDNNTLVLKCDKKSFRNK